MQSTANGSSPSERKPCANADHHSRLNKDEQEEANINMQEASWAPPRPTEPARSCNAHEEGLFCDGANLTACEPQAEAVF